MRPHPRLTLSCAAVLLAFPAVLAAAAPAPKPSPEAVELFERDVRPVLVDHCQPCHGAKEAKGGLRLLERADALKGGKSGPALVPGNPAASLLARALEHTGPLKMPPAGKLPGAQIARVRRWIALGAPWPAARKTAAPAPGEFRPTDAQRRWWAYQPLRPVTPPSFPGAERETEIDRFLLAELRKRKLPRARPADRRTLIRRATFDLTGLPPTPEEVDAFLRDRSPDAWEKVVDRLLASPAYGQRTARRWLDVVRYADYHDGNPKARDANCEPMEAWRYRDWVVDAFNRDLPFDRFIVHQIAGDLLPPPPGQELYADGLVATTFLSNGAWDRGDADKEKMVSDMVDDQIDTIGKAFLGVTLGCARCHDHKFDPVSQKDYYALAGIFYSTRILKDLGAKGANYVLLRTPLAPAAEVARREELLRQLGEVNGKLAELDKRTPPAPAEDPERAALIARRDRLQAELPPAPPMAEAAREGGTPGGLFPKIGDVPVHLRGSYTRLGEVVPRGLPAFLARGAQVPITQGSGRRELAAWVASPRNPLTARVIVNRVWQWHFGTGLVQTPNNFGLLSEPPSHPELLDWLAVWFTESGTANRLNGRVGEKGNGRKRFPPTAQGLTLNALPSSRGFNRLSSTAPNLPSATSTSLSHSPTPPLSHSASPNAKRPTPNAPQAWSIKRLHRLIMLSSAYQQSCGNGGGSGDPENRWLGRFSPRRLEAEEIRDAMLAASGRLDPAPGGPATDDLDTPRRSLYVQTARWDRSSFASLFDAANPDASVERRTVSTVAPQALFLLNHGLTHATARRLAERLLREPHPDPAARVRRAYELLFARPPTAAELAIAERILGPPGRREPAAAWADLAHVLLSTNELLYLD